MITYLISAVELGGCLMRIVEVLIQTFMNINLFNYFFKRKFVADGSNYMHYIWTMNND